LPQRSPTHKNWFARASAGRLFAPLPPAHSLEALFRPERARPEDSLLQTPGIPKVSWFPSHLRTVRHRSTDRERGFGQGSLAAHMIRLTSVSPRPEFPRTLVGMKPANHRANHPVAGKGVRWGDPRAS